MNQSIDWPGLMSATVGAGLVVVNWLLIDLNGRFQFALEMMTPICISFA